LKVILSSCFHHQLILYLFISLSEEVGLLIVLGLGYGSRVINFIWKGIGFEVRANLCVSLVIYLPEDFETFFHTIIFLEVGIAIFSLVGLILHQIFYSTMIYKQSMI